MHGSSSVLGLSSQTWTYVEVASGLLLLATTARTAANTIGGQGIFGYGKNQTLANYGKKNSANWASLQALSLAIVAVTMLKNNLDAVAEQMDTFVSFVSFLNDQFQIAVSKRRFGASDGDTELHYDIYLSGLCQFLGLSGDLPVHETVVQILQDTLGSLRLSEHAPAQNEFADLFELYLESGLVDWDFVDGVIKSSDRSLRSLVITHLSIDNVEEVLPRILKWVEHDSASMMRLADVLKGAHNQLQAAVLSALSDASASSAMVMLLTRFRDVEVFKNVIDSLRDEDGLLDTDQESNVSPLFNALSVMATDKAEYYLRDLSDDKDLSFELRLLATRAAKVAYRRRVPLHVRRADRS